MEMAIQSAVVCSVAKDGGLLMSWQLIECVMVWTVSSSLLWKAFFFIIDKSFVFKQKDMNLV